ncbi:hypothetical protein BSKO_01917 [Bryopsis sp. KO-2023]|nr:hypothetical protein BSKO_01917 [Bryopsis sp. KO-2023]
MLQRVTTPGVSLCSGVRWRRSCASSPTPQHNRMSRFHKRTTLVRSNQKMDSDVMSFEGIPGWVWAAALPLLEQPAQAAEISEGGFSQSSYYVTLGLFIVTLPGLWSLIKRSAKSKIRRRTYEVDGPARDGAVPLDTRAAQIATHFAKYNYEIGKMGEVITFVGKYKASTSQALSLVLYTFFSLGSAALVLSIQFPDIGSWWYLVTVISPLAGIYYWQNGNREEEIKVKMVTTDDETVTDIILEGDEEELDRFSKELDLMEKGKIKVKGLLER